MINRKKKSEVLRTDNNDNENKTNNTQGAARPSSGTRRVRAAVIAAAAALALILSASALYFFAGASLSPKGDAALSVPVFEKYTDEGASAAFLCFDISDKAECLSDVNTDVPGEYHVRYLLDFHGKHYEAERQVFVVDGEPPEITLEGEEEMILSDMSFYAEPGFSASDACDGTLTDRVETQIVEDGEECTIIYSVSDLSGNRAERRRKITVRDIIPPVLSLAGEADMTVEAPAFSDPGCSAVDDLDGDITALVHVSSDYTPGCEGDFTFVYSVSDKAGNEAEAVRTVHVSDTQPPVITLNGGAKIYIFEGSVYTDAGAAAYDDFDGDLTSSLTSSGEVNPAVPGTYTVSYSVSDKKGNVSSASRCVTVYARPVPVGGTVCGGGVVSASTVYLTFDDGPSDCITPQILDILKANNVKATFFIINYSSENKPIVSRIIAEGHTIGIHGYSHDYAEIYSSTEAFFNNVARLQKKLYEDFGYNTNIIRFPGGSSNTVSRKYCPGIMTALASLAEEQGFAYFDWNVSSGDAAGGAVSSDAIVKNVTGGLRAGRSNVVLMHDTNAKATTAAALQAIIDYGTENGYTFAALSSNTPPVHHGIKN